jgi:hypothetical protein
VGTDRSLIVTTEQTSDPHVQIAARGVLPDGRTYVEYVNDATPNERWRIYGDCNMCGACWVGAVNAVPDKDCPVRPEISQTPGCVLTGEYL